MNAPLQHARPQRSRLAILPTGALEHVDPDGVVEGWCWHPGAPQIPSTVTIRSDGIEVARTRCNVMRPDLAAAGIGTGAHGFLCILPPESRIPGATAAISLHTEHGHPIGPPVHIIWRAAALAPLEGNLDSVTPDGMVSGWCWLPGHPDAPVVLDVLVDNQMAGQTRADQFRPDLAAEHIGTGAHGFAFPLPWQALDGRGRVEITLREAKSGRPFGSPAILRLGPLSATEDRMATLERELHHLRAEITHLTAELDRRDANPADPTLYATIGALFTELGAAADPPTTLHRAAPDISVRHALARLHARHPPITLAFASSPIATILIPANSDLATTYACLAALHAQALDQRAAILLVASPDAPSDLAMLPTLVSNLRNAHPPSPGLAAALATAPQAHPAVWLDPSLIPTPGWLDTLLATLDHNTTAAAVSARVIGHDGLIRDSTHDHLADAQAPELAALRPVAAIAALCFALRPGTSPEGQKLLLQPHATAQCDDAADLSTTETIQGAPHSFVGHALVIDTALPRPDHDAGSLATVEQLQVLRRLGWRVTFAAATGIDALNPAAIHLETHGIELVRPPASGSITAWLQQHGRGLDLVQVWRHQNATQFLPRIRALAPSARLVFAPADLHHLRESRRLELAGAPAASSSLRDQERACVRAADATLLHSDAELALLRHEVPPGRLHLMRWIASPSPSSQGFADRDGICFVGSFTHSPNQDALRWFITDIMPVLREARPGITLHIAGSGIPDAFFQVAAPDIIVHGWIADLAAFFAARRLSIAPLRYGAGFKGKIATSLSFGVPVVATTIALEGSGLATGDGIAIADIPAATVEAIIRLHDTEHAWRRHADRAIEACHRLYAPEAAERIYRDMLQALGLPKPTSAQ